MLFIFNLWSYPVSKASMPSELSTYYLGKYPDTTWQSTTNYFFENDSLIKVVERDSSILVANAKIDTITDYWTLNHSRHILFRSPIPNGDSTGKNFIKYIYRYDTLIQILQYSSGSINYKEDYIYENGVLTKTIDSSFFEKFKTQHFYRYKNGVISERDDLIGNSLSYKKTYDYLGDNVISVTSTVILGNSSGGKEIFFYKNGKIFKMEDYDVDKLSGLVVFKYNDMSSVKQIQPINSKISYKRFNLLGQVSLKENEEIIQHIYTSKCLLSHRE